MKRVPKRIGWAVQSDHGWFFLALGTEIYAFHVELGALSVAWLANQKRVQRRLAVVKK